LTGPITPENWRIDKIAVVGAGIVGMPMAALLAAARIRIGSQEPAPVVIIQRDSPTSGWKVGAINAGRSPIGGIEPELDRIVKDSVAEGLLSASHDYAELRDADVILVCVQTDKRDFGPDYSPLFEALECIAEELRQKPPAKLPLVIFESTLAPSTMNTLILDLFRDYGLEEGRDVLLGNSPNRVMPGRLVERIRTSDKVVGGLNPLTPRLIQSLYAHIVTEGTLQLTNSMTAEVVKTLENAYRDVRIAFSAEIVRYCDDRDIDFYHVRKAVNRMLSWSDAASDNPIAVPSGGLLIPTIGVGGHCLPKDGILLLWREIEAGEDMSKSLILESRRINDESPVEAIRLAERDFGELYRRRVALLGAAYRFDSEDTRNSPALALAELLLDRENDVVIHDPYVKPDDQNLLKYSLQNYFTRDLDAALIGAEFVFFCTAHRFYLDEIGAIVKSSPRIRGFFDGCNLFAPSRFPGAAAQYAGIGRGRNPAPEDFLNFVYESFGTIEKGFSNEIQGFIDFANARFAANDFNRIDFKDVKRIARTCVTGCLLADPGPLIAVPEYEGLTLRLLNCLAQGI
jgi:UDP-N-acetyl-D-mannosaminuronic acid dehydrogenase